MAVALTTKQIRIKIYINEKYKNTVQTIQKHSKYKYTCYQNTHTLQNPHIHTHTLQNPHIYTPTRYKTHTYTNPHITKPTHTHPHITKPTHIQTHTLQSKLKQAQYKLKQKQ